VHGERQDILSREEIEKQKCGRVVIAYLPAGVSDQLDTPTPITDAVFQSDNGCESPIRTLITDSGGDRSLSPENSGDSDDGQTEAAAARQIDASAVAKLRTWFDAHFEYPQPSRAELTKLCADTQLQPQRIKKWIDNAKQRTDGPWRAMRSRGRPVRRAIEVISLLTVTDPMETFRRYVVGLDGMQDAGKTHVTIVRAPSEIGEQLSRLPASAGLWQHPRGGSVVVLRTIELLS